MQLNAKSLFEVNRFPSEMRMNQIIYSFSKKKEGRSENSNKTKNSKYSNENKLLKS